jgi:hypothetical protein
MKLHAFAILAGTVFALAPAYADDARPAPKGPPKTMGDEGTLPSTSTVGGHVPNMGSADPATSPSDGPVTQKGPPKRMGDEGTLPATNKMGGAIPQMNEDNQ